jgi:hypothetical protein
MSLTLNNLLADIEASSAAMEKSASANTEVTPAVADEFASVLTKKAEQDLTKEAHAQGEILAKQLLEKFANQIIVNDNAIQADQATDVVATAPGVVEDVLQSTVEEGLDRGATSDDRVDAMVDAGKGTPTGEQLPAGDNQLTNKDEVVGNTKIAQYIMQKLAEEAAQTAGTSADVPTPVAVNQIQANDAQMVAADDAKVQENPGTEGTISNVLEAIVARAQAQGAGTDDLVNGSGVTPPQREDEAVEKAAAVSALVAEGCDFDMAVDLVKQAEAELAVDAFEQEKQAALSTLMEAGVNFDDAVALIKQAEEDLAEGFDKEAGVASGAISAAKGVARKLGAHANAAKPAAKVLLTGKGPAGSVVAGSGSNRAIAAKVLAKNPAVQAAAGATALGISGVAAAREKKAAFDALIESGVDFEKAAQLVIEASLEVYGE